MQDKKPWWNDALMMFGRVTVWVVVPIVAALLVGTSLDTKYGTKPVIFLSLTGLAFIVSITAITRLCLAYIKKIDSEQKDSDNGK